MTAWSPKLRPNRIMDLLSLRDDEYRNLLLRLQNEDMASLVGCLDNVSLQMALLHAETNDGVIGSFENL